MVDWQLIAVTATLFVGVRLFYLTRRRLRFRFPSELAEALKTHERDPIEGRRLIDAYFTKDAAREEQERSALWARAQMDVKAAKELRVRLREDLAANAAARKDLQEPATKNASAEGEVNVIQQLDEDDRRTNQQLEQLDEILKRLGQR